MERHVQDNLSVRLKKSGHFQIRDNFGHLFVEKRDLKSPHWQASKLNRLTKAVVAGGARALDPYPQRYWRDKTILGHEWPADPKTICGPVRIFKPNPELTYFDTLCPEAAQVGQVYKVKPRGFIYHEPNSSSITLAFQQQNLHPKYAFGPWLVAPFVNPSQGMLIAFPRVEHKHIQEKSDATPERCYHLGELTFFNPYLGLTKQPNKLFFNQVNLVMLAKVGSKEVILIRSSGHHKDQFQIFEPLASKKLLQPEYTELEWTGAPVKQGEISSLLVKLDFLTLESPFGQTGNLEQELFTSYTRLKSCLSGQ